MKYRFAECVLDTSRHELLVDRELRAVEPQVFDLLRHMIENPGRLITHDELIENIWQGRIVSDSAISASISAARAAIGDSGAKQMMIKTVPRRGFQFICKVQDSPDTQVPPVHVSHRDAGASDTPYSAGQRVKFCKSHDGTRIAYGTTAKGYPLVRAGHWLTHLEHDWHSPVWRPFLNELGRDFCVTRYDQRGNGLSDWAVDDYSLDKFVGDLETVVDAVGLERFALYGTSQGAPISIAYAVRHPERVCHLILHGGYAVGRLVRADAQEREQGHALLTLMRHGWGKPGSPFINAFSSMYIPDGSKEQIDSLVELQRLSTSPENATNLRTGVDSFDVSALLQDVSTPTLVLHSRNDGVHSLEHGQSLAARIAGAEFVMLESGNHVILEQEPAWNILFEEIKDFVLN
jgi:pimeloyl-ACP methyl ester carboxylesterase